MVKSNNNEVMWCLARDFNLVRKVEERRGETNNEHTASTKMNVFNQFIDNMEVEDLPMLGRKNTRYRSNRHAKNRIDRFLVSREWFSVWPGCAQYVLKRLGKVFMCNGGQHTLLKEKLKILKYELKKWNKEILETWKTPVKSW
ncbi:hypothetical protein CR513_01075, partial [Mucuna pruriens]